MVEWSKIASAGTTGLSSIWYQVLQQAGLSLFRWQYPKRKSGSTQGFLRPRFRIGKLFLLHSIGQCKSQDQPTSVRGDYRLQGKERGYKEANNWGYECYQSAIFVYVNFLFMVVPHAIPSVSQSKLVFPVWQILRCYHCTGTRPYLRQCMWGRNREGG